MKRLTWITAAVSILILLVGLISLMKKDPEKDAAPAERFMAYDDGTILDTATGLMWAAKDNGSAATWQTAKAYCENYEGGGYTDWRMPAVEELASLYDKYGPGYRPECAVYDWKVFLAGKIHLTGGSAWASKDYGKEAECFMFDYGCRSRMFKSVNFIMRALPVRDAV